MSSKGTDKKRPKKRHVRSELDKLLMDEGTVNMLSNTTSSSVTNGNGLKKYSYTSKKAKLEALRIKRLQVISSVKSRSSDTGKNLREKKKSEVVSPKQKKDYKKRDNLKYSIQSGGGNLGSSWLKGRRASLLATLKEERNGTNGTNDTDGTQNQNSGPGALVLKRILSNVTKDGLGHITITFQSNGRWAIDLRTLKDFVSTLKTMGTNPAVKIILISSSGTKFCNGIDLRELIGADKKKIAEEMAEAVNDYFSTISSLKKLTIISVHASVSNLFVTSLPLFDLVYASDKSTFRCNYLNLNQVPEGGKVIHESLGKTAFTNLIYGRRVLTASEAKECGLVTEVLWPARFQEEVVMRVRSLLSLKSSSLPLTKSSLPKLTCLSESNLLMEKNNLVQSWSSPEFQLAARNFVNSRELKI